MRNSREIVGPSPPDILLDTRVPNSYFKEVYLTVDYSRVGHRVAQRGSVKDEPPGRASHLYPVDVPAGLYAQAHYKGGATQGVVGWVSSDLQCTFYFHLGLFCSCLF